MHISIYNYIENIFTSLFMTSWCHYLSMTSQQPSMTSKYIFCEFLQFFLRFCFFLFYSLIFTFLYQNCFFPLPVKFFKFRNFMKKCKKINPKFMLTSAFQWQKFNTNLLLTKTTIHRLSKEGSIILIALVVLKISNFKIYLFFSKFSIYDVINDDLSQNQSTSRYFF